MFFPRNAGLAAAIFAFNLEFAASAAVVLRVDVNDAVDNPADTAPAFSDYALSDNTFSLPPFTVDINPASGAALDDVHRATPLTHGFTLFFRRQYGDGILKEKLFDDTAVKTFDRLVLHCFFTHMTTWSSAGVAYLGETLAGDGTATMKWRTAAPITGAPQQYLRVRATLAP